MLWRLASGYLPGMNREIAALALVLAAFLFAPADRIAAPAQGPMIPEVRMNVGYVFIGKVGGTVVLRHTQWFGGIAVAGAIAAVLVFGKRKTKSE